VIETRHGELKVHPALAEARQQRIVLTRILATLGLNHDGRRKQPRGTRGMYGIKGAVK
jgi:phage terminase small subunit